MKVKLVLCIAVLAGLLVPASSSQAWLRVGIGIGIPIGGYYPYYPYYYGPPVVVAPPPRVIYVQQQPTTVIAQPAQVVQQPVYQSVPAGTTVYQAPPPQVYQPSGAQPAQFPQQQTPPTPIALPAR